MAFLDFAGWLGSLLPKLDEDSDHPISDLIGIPNRFDYRFQPAIDKPLQQMETRRTVPDVLAPVAATQEMMPRQQAPVPMPTPQQLAQPPQTPQPPPMQSAPFGGTLNA